jgi:hypothetical protein
MKFKGLGSFVGNEVDYCDEKLLHTWRDRSRIVGSEAGVVYAEVTVLLRRVYNFVTHRSHKVFDFHDPVLKFMSMPRSWPFDQHTFSSRASSIS